MNGSCNKAGSVVLTETLRRNERRHRRRQRWHALLLLLPVLIFLAFNFLAPLGNMLYRSIHNDSVASLIPRTSQALQQWTTPDTLPLPALYALSHELPHLAQNRQAGKLATAVNRHYAGATSLINRTARQLRRTPSLPVDAQDAHALLVHIDQRWNSPELWQAIAEASRSFTDYHYLTALDLERTAHNHIQPRHSARIYLPLYGKTLGMAALITLLCAVLGYPLAYVLAHARNTIRGLLLILILLPFWTSLLVRTAAWMALLQNNGLINRILTAIGIIDTPLALLYTRFSTILAMTHILLPFMILPLYSVMRAIDHSYMRAALSLGAHPWHAFKTIYLPLSLPGLSAGALLVFIISVGYYITPALLGGTDGQMIANLIAFHMQESNNWGLAAALGGLLLLIILALYYLYDKWMGIAKMRLY